MLYKTKVYAMAKAHLVIFLSQINESLKQDIVGLHDRIPEYETHSLAYTEKRR